MTTYSTDNPLGSTDPRDLYDNSENLDYLVNGNQPAYNDRLGNARKSWSGIEDDFQKFLSGSGYVGTGTNGAIQDYSSGIELTSYNQIIRDNGEFWRLSASENLPYTTTGSGIPEGGALVSVGDATLRQNLSSDTGADLVVTSSGDTVEAAINQRIIYVGSVSELRASSGLSGCAYIQGYYGKGTAGGGHVYLDESDTSSLDDGGLVFVDADGGRWKRQTNGFVTVEMFGAQRGQDSTEEWQKAIEASSVVVSEDPEYRHIIGGTVTAYSKVTIANTKFLLPETQTGFILSGDDCLIYRCDFLKDGDLSESQSGAWLVDVTGDGFKALYSNFQGQHACINISGDNSEVSGCKFSDGVWMLRLAGAKHSRISGCYFTRGRTTKDEASVPEGDGIKLSGDTPCENVTITGNVFFNCYRDCIDAFIGGRNITITGNTMDTFGWKALDAKVRAQQTFDSSDGRPLCKDIVVSSNVIIDRQDRSSEGAEESAIVFYTSEAISEDTISRPTSLEDVRALGFSNALFCDNYVEVNHQCIFNIKSSYGIKIYNNQFEYGGSDVGRFAWGNNAYLAEISNNIINSRLASNNLSFGQGTGFTYSKNRIYGSTFFIDEPDSTVTDNLFDFQGKPGCTLRHEGNTFIGNTLQGSSGTSLTLGDSMTKSIVMNNIFRDSGSNAIFSTTFSDSSAGNVVRNNTSLDGGGGYSNLTRVIDAGGISDGNLQV